MDAAEPSRISDRSRRARYEDARERFITAQAALHSPIDLDTGVLSADSETRGILIDQARRNANVARTAAFHQAKAAFDAVVAEICAAQDPPDFLNTVIEPAMILSTAEQGGQGHALVYLAATPWGGVAVAC